MYVHIPLFAGLFYAEYGEQTLAMFLLYLNTFPKCEIQKGEPAIKFYYGGETANAIWSEEINSELNSKT